MSWKPFTEYLATKIYDFQWSQGDIIFNDSQAIFSEGDRVSNDLYT